MISRKAKTSIRRKSWQTSRWNWNWNNEEARVWVLDKKKQTGIAPFSFLRCKFGGKIGGERGGSVHVSPMSTHDRSCVGRGINMKSCRLIYDPGRPLLDLWRYSPLFTSGKRRLYFLSAATLPSTGPNRRSSSLSLQSFLSNLCFFFSFFKTLQFREIYTLSNVGKDSRTIFLHFSSRRLQLIEIQVM